jgi:AraC-like DNA-binding protein
MGGACRVMLLWESILAAARRPVLNERADLQQGKLITGGRICFWQGGSLWLGRGQGRSDWHAHHAHQIAIPLAGGCRFRSKADDEWTSFAGAIVASHGKHQFEFEGTIAHLFVEPETPQGRALTRHIADAGVSHLPHAERDAAVKVLIDAEASGRSGDALIATGREVLAILTGAGAAGAPVDRRVIKAIEYVGFRVREPVALADAASAAALSPGRFRHLFVQETGTPFRAYLLWLRLNVAIEAAMAGRTWTAAAHEAGFADAAHFTRTFKRMFGINPVELAAARIGRVRTGG